MLVDKDAQPYPVIQNIAYTEEHENWSQARKREKYFKSSAGKKYIDHFLRCKQ